MICLVTKPISAEAGEPIHVSECLKNAILRKDIFYRRLPFFKIHHFAELVVVSAPSPLENCFQENPCFCGVM